MAMLPGKSAISSAIKYREKIFTAVPDPKRTEPYKLRGKKQYLMGHSEIGVTMNVYTHLGLDDAAEELAKLQAMEDAKKEQEKVRQNTFRIYEPEAI